MSFDTLLTKRPLYQIKIPNTTQQVTPRITPRQAEYHIPSEFKKPKLECLSPSTIEVALQLPGLFYQAKKCRIQNSYNSIADFNNKSQIITALKLLQSAEERTILIDKILARKNEMQLATLKLKAKKLQPIFKVITRKFKKEAEMPMKKQTMFQQPVQPPQDEQLTDNQKIILEKLQARYTTSLAFSWLTDRNKKSDSQLQQEDLSPASVRRRERRCTQLQESKQQSFGKNNMLYKKVSENSDQMIQFGKKKIEEYSIKKLNLQDMLKNTRSKVETGICRRQRRKETLAFFTSQRIDDHNSHVQAKKQAIKENLMDQDDSL